MSNQEYDFVESEGRARHISFNKCPTCDARKEEIFPGVWEWPQNRTYKLFGETHPCNCAEQIELLRHYILAGIPKDYWPLSDSATDYWGDPKALAAIKDYFEKWNEYKRFGIGLQIYSPQMGVGKTMLASLLAKWLIHEGERVLFISFREAVSLYHLADDKREAKTERLKNIPILILDEVSSGFTEAQRNYLALELENLLRFRTSGNTVTIVTTNLTPDELEQEYARCFSLLSSKQIMINVNGSDVRKNGDKQLLDLELIANKEVRPII